MAKKHHLFIAKKIYYGLVWESIHTDMNKDRLYEIFYEKFKDELTEDTIYSYFTQSIRILKKIGLKERDGKLYFSRSRQMNELEFLKQLRLEKTNYVGNIHKTELSKLHVMQLNLISKKEFKRIYEKLVDKNKMIYLAQIDVYRFKY